jgi:hypothetical protein
MRVAFFTGGTVGAGHLARGIAVGRALARAGFGGSYRMFGPRQPFAAGARDDWEAVDIRPDLLGAPEAAPHTELAQRILAFAPDLLIVDMFWAPLRYALPSLACERWLLLRSFPSPWLVGPPGAPFDAGQYSRIVAIEPVSAPAITHTIDPIVLVNPDEQKPRGALRRRLGASDDQRLVAVMQAGVPGERAQLAPAPKTNELLVTLDMFAAEALFPAAEWLGDCDAIHCGAGYNSFWEARWLGYAARTMFTPFPRRNDDQGWRLTRCIDHPMLANGADTLARWIAT